MSALTTANQLTLFRLFAVPCVVILVLYGFDGWALITFVVAGVTDALDGVIAWGGRDRLPAELAGRPVQLHVRLRSARLYAFQFAA